MNVEGIQYQVRKNARSRSLRIRVFRDGSVSVTIPRRVSIATANAFVAARREWILEKLEYITSLAPLAPSRYTQTEYKKNKGAARLQIAALVEHYAQRYGFSYKAITIRNQKTCWGSCSRRKTLSFNWKIPFLPTPLQEYIIIHELCHLQEMNHSTRFWGLVKSIIPDYTERRQALRASGQDYQ